VMSHPPCMCRFPSEGMFATTLLACDSPKSGIVSFSSQVTEVSYMACHMVIDDEKLVMPMDECSAPHRNLFGSGCWSGFCQVLGIGCSVERQLQVLTEANTRHNAGPQNKRRLCRLRLLKQNRNDSVVVTELVVPQVVC